MDQLGLTIGKRGFASEDAEKRFRKGDSHEPLQKYNTVYQGLSLSISGPKPAVLGVFQGIREALVRLLALAGGGLAVAALGKIPRAVV